MILHFVSDDKVTDQIIENFGKVDENSCFLVFVNSKKNGFKFISSTSEKLIEFSILEDDINLIIKRMKPTAIVAHAFHLDYAKAILKIENNITIAWYIWGFDVYGLPQIKPNTYAELTDSFLLKTESKLRVGRKILKHDFLRKVFYKLNKTEEDRYSYIYKALKKVNYFVTYLEEDYQYFSKFYPNNFKFVNSTFSTIDQYLAGNQNVEIHEKAANILIGNSNSAESNHLDAFNIIKKFGFLEDAKIFVPLSYGPNEIYKEEVIKTGRMLMGTSFVPLLDFMERSDYIDILASCSTGVFYHYRQQAMGNIIAMLYIGARVYLSSKNPAYEFFVKNDIKVFDFDKDYEVFKNTKLEINIVEKNRKILSEIFNEQKVFDDIRKFTNLLS